MEREPSIKQTHGRSLNDHPVENFRPLRVIVIGAGFSGIYMGIRIPQLLRNIDLTIYEKNQGVGGTWWENRYPGCACDIPGELRISESLASRKYQRLLMSPTTPQPTHMCLLSSLIQDGLHSTLLPVKFRSI